MKYPEERPGGWNPKERLPACPGVSAEQVRNKGITTGGQFSMGFHEAPSSEPGFFVLLHDSRVWPLPNPNYLCTGASQHCPRAPADQCRKHQRGPLPKQPSEGSFPDPHPCFCCFLSESSSLPKGHISALSKRSASLPHGAPATATGPDG